MLNTVSTTIGRFLGVPTTTRERIVKNLVFKFISELLPRALTFLVLIVIARLLGTAEFGLFSYGSALAAMLVVVTDFGWNTVIVRRLASKDTFPVVSATFQVKIAAAVLVMVGQIIFGQFFPYRIPSMVMFFILLSTLTFSFQDTFGAISLGKEHLEWEIVLKVIPRVILLTTFAVFFFIPATLTSVSVMYTLANLVGFTIGSTWFFKQIPKWQKADSAAIKTLLREGIPFGIIGSLWIFYLRQDIILLGHSQASADEMGYYATASKILDIGRLVPIVLQMALVPVFASLATDPRRVMKHTFKMIRYASLGLLVLIAGFTWGALPLVVFLFGPAYAPAQAPLQIGGIAIGLSMMNVPLTAAIIALKYEKGLMGTTALALIVNLIANLLFIPSLSYQGPAWALLISETVWFVSNLLLFWICIRQSEGENAHLPRD